MVVGWELPSIRVPDLSKDPSAAELLTRGVALSVERLFSNLPESDPESIHQARVATRRLRSDLGTFKSLFRPGAWDIRRDLQPLAALLGEMRNHDVFVAQTSANAILLDAGDLPIAEALLAVIGRRRDDDLERLRAYLETFDGVATRLTALSCAPPLKKRSKHQGTTALTPLVRERWKRLTSAVRELDDPDGPALHRIRILTKRVRYGAELVAPAVGRKADRFAAAAARLQDVLGDHHDADVAIGFLTAAARRLTHGHAAALGQLAGLELARRSRAEIEWREAYAALRAKELRKWM